MFFGNKIASKQRAKIQSRDSENILCRFCAKLIDLDDAVKCSRCTSQFHPACANKTPKSVDGAFVICCQSELDSVSLSQESILVLSTDNSLVVQFGTMRDEFRDVNSHIRSLTLRVDQHQE